MSYRQPQSPNSHHTLCYNSEFRSERSSISLGSHFDLVKPTIHLPPTSKALQGISFTACPSSRSSETISSESDITQKPHTELIRSLGIRKVDSWKPSNRHTNFEDSISTGTYNLENLKANEDEGEDNLRCTRQSQEKYAKGREVFLPAHKKDYIDHWKSSLPGCILPPETHKRHPRFSDDTFRERGDDLQRKIVDLNDQIGYMKRFISLLVSSPSYTSIVRCLSRLCGLFSPAPQFFSALAELSFVIGTRRSFDWVHDPSLLDEAISRCLTILLRAYDDTSYLSEDELQQMRMERFRPSDVLWVLVHTCDYHILDSLERVMEIMKNSTKRMTQRWIILTILLYKIRSNDQIDQNHYHSRRRRARDGEGFKGWAKRQALLFARNFWTLDYCQATPNQTRNSDGLMKYIDDDEGLENINRISTAEIRRIIIDEQYRYNTNGVSNRMMNRKKRKFITYEGLHAVESDIEGKSEDGDNHTDKRVRR